MTTHEVPCLSVDHQSWATAQFILSDDLDRDLARLLKAVPDLEPETGTIDPDHEEFPVWDSVDQFLTERGLA